MDHVQAIISLRTTDDSQDLFPVLKAPGTNPLIHQEKPQHIGSKLRGYLDTHPSLPPLTKGNSRLRQIQAPLQETGSTPSHAFSGPGPPRPHELSPSN